MRFIEHLKKRIRRAQEWEKNDIGISRGILILLCETAFLPTMNESVLYSRSIIGFSHETHGSLHQSGSLRSHSAF